MGINFGDHLIDSGYYDITPEQEREIEEARDKEMREHAYDCPCGGWDCSGVPGGPLLGCPYAALSRS